MRLSCISISSFMSVEVFIVFVLIFILLILTFISGFNTQWRFGKINYLFGKSLWLVQEYYPRDSLTISEYIYISVICLSDGGKSNVIVLYWGIIENLTEHIPRSLN